MNSHRSLNCRRRALILLAFNSVLVAALWAAPPKVSRIEPPNWWAGHTHNPVRVLITGEHLQEATMISTNAGIEVRNLRQATSGNCLFADVSISAEAADGWLLVTNCDGVDAIQFPVLPKSVLREPQGFSPDDVIYLVMTDRFANGDAGNDDPPQSRGLHDRRLARFYHGGDFAGLMQRLDYLQDLGITALWLTPWYDNANRLNHQEKYTVDNQLSSRGRPITDYHGYGAVDFYGVDEHFGDLAALQQLVRAAQSRGIKVIQDQVANHTGPYHPWITRPPTPTWFNGSPTNHLENKWQTWTTTTPNPPQDQLKATLEGWFINILPDLNQNDPEAATYLIQNSLWWIGMTGLDAVRQDTLPYVPRSYWAKWTAALKRQHPKLTVLGEMWHDDPRLVSFFQGGRKQFDGVDSGVDTLFDFPLYNAIRDVFARGQPMTRLTDTLAVDSLYVDASVLVPFLGLHDTPRFLHESGASLETMKLAFTFLLTTRGTPLIYYGDEIAMRGGGDPDNRRDFPGGWRDDAHNAFEVTGRTSEQEAMHAHVKQLLGLRRQLLPLRRGGLKHLTVTSQTYAYARVAGDEFVVVALNKSGETQSFDVSLKDICPATTTVLSDRLGELGRVALTDSRLRFTLPPRSAALFTPPVETASGNGADGLSEANE